jgi:hypothetical protein
MSGRSPTRSPILAPAPAQVPDGDREGHRARLRHDRRRVLVPDPMTVARNFDALTRGAVAYRERKRRIAALARDPQAMHAVPLDQIRQYLSRRQFEVAILHLGHYTLPEIARHLGYASGKHVHAVLRTPAVARFIQCVEAAQVERCIAGEFGVRAQAKAAAPRVMERVIEKAGGKLGADGKPLGEAVRDADLIRAADLVLTIGGEKDQRQEHLHKHVHLAFEAMTIDELRRLGETGEWPERFQSLVARLGLDQKRDD